MRDVMRWVIFGLLMVLAGQANAQPFGPTVPVFGPGSTPGPTATTGGCVSTPCVLNAGDSVTATGGTTALTLGTWFSNPVNALGQGATGDGSTNDAAALLAASVVAQTGGRALFFPTPATSYLLNSDVKPASGDMFVSVNPGYAQSGAGLLRFDNQVPDQHSPVLAFQLLSKSYGSAFDGYASGNVFQFGSVVTNNNAAGTPVVSVFGEGIANTALAGTLNNSAWGLNAVGVAAVASSNAFASELDCVALDAAITGCVGASVNAAGTNKSTRAIDIRANNDNAGWQYGLNFTGGTHEPVVHSLIVSNGAINPENFVNFLSAKATAAEVNIPSFQIGASKSSPDSRVAITAGDSGSSPTISVIANSGGATANKGLQVLSLGTGNINFLSGGGQNFRISDSGGTSVAFLTASGAQSGNDVVLQAQTVSGSGNANVDIKAFGTGSVILKNANGVSLQVLDGGASTVNSLTVKGSATGVSVKDVALGGDANINRVVSGAGTGIVCIAANTDCGNEALRVIPVASQVNQLSVAGSIASTSIKVSTRGSDSAVNLAIIAKGAASIICLGGGMSDCGNEAVRISSVASMATSVSLTGATSGGTAVVQTAGVTGNLQLGSGGLATNFTVGGIFIPTTAGIPSGTVGSASLSSLVTNTTSHKLCHSEGGGTWYDATGAACS